VTFRASVRRRHQSDGAKFVILTWLWMLMFVLCSADDIPLTTFIGFLPESDEFTKDPVTNLFLILIPICLLLK
jgi:hypothetical protein